MRIEGENDLREGRSLSSIYTSYKRTIGRTLEDGTNSWVTTFNNRQEMVIAPAEYQLLRENPSTSWSARKEQKKKLTGENRHFDAPAEGISAPGCLNSVCPWRDHTRQGKEIRLFANRKEGSSELLRNRRNL